MPRHSSPRSRLSHPVNGPSLIPQQVLSGREPPSRHRRSLVDPFKAFTANDLDNFIGSVSSKIRSALRGSQTPSVSPSQAGCHPSCDVFGHVTNLRDGKPPNQPFNNPLPSSASAPSPLSHNDHSPHSTGLRHQTFTPQVARTNSHTTSAGQDELQSSSHRASPSIHSLGSSSDGGPSAINDHAPPLYEVDSSGAPNLSANRHNGTQSLSSSEDRENDTSTDLLSSDSDECAEDLEVEMEEDQEFRVESDLSLASYSETHTQSVSSSSPSPPGSGQAISHAALDSSSQSEQLEIAEDTIIIPDSPLSPQRNQQNGAESLESTPGSVSLEESGSLSHPQRLLLFSHSSEPLATSHQTSLCNMPPGTFGLSVTEAGLESVDQPLLHSPFCLPEQNHMPVGSSATAEAMVPRASNESSSAWPSAIIPDGLSTFVTDTAQQTEAPLGLASIDTEKGPGSKRSLVLSAEQDSIPALSPPGGPNVLAAPSAPELSDNDSQVVASDSLRQAPPAASQALHHAEQNITRDRQSLIEDDPEDDNDLFEGDRDLHLHHLGEVSGCRNDDTAALHDRCSPVLADEMPLSEPVAPHTASHFSLPTGDRFQEFLRRVEKHGCQANDSTEGAGELPTSQLALSTPVLDTSAVLSGGSQNILPNLDSTVVDFPGAAIPTTYNQPSDHGTIKVKPWGGFSDDETTRDVNGDSQMRELEFRPIQTNLPLPGNKTTARHLALHSPSKFKCLDKAPGPSLTTSNSVSPSGLSFSLPQINGRLSLCPRFGDSGSELDLMGGPHGKASAVELKLGLSSPYSDQEDFDMLGSSSVDMDLTKNANPDPVRRTSHSPELTGVLGPTEASPGSLPRMLETPLAVEVQDPSDIESRASDFQAPAIGRFSTLPTNLLAVRAPNWPREAKADSDDADLFLSQFPQGSTSRDSLQAGEHSEKPPLVTETLFTPAVTFATCLPTHARKSSDVEDANGVGHDVGDRASAVTRTGPLILEPPTPLASTTVGQRTSSEASEHILSRGPESLFTWSAPSSVSSGSPSSPASVAPPPPLPSASMGAPTEAVGFANHISRRPSADSSTHAEPPSPSTSTRQRSAPFTQEQINTPGLPHIEEALEAGNAPSSDLPNPLEPPPPMNYVMISPCPHSVPQQTSQASSVVAQPPSPMSAKGVIDLSSSVGTLATPHRPSRDAFEHGSLHFPDSDPHSRVLSALGPASPQKLALVPASATVQPSAAVRLEVLQAAWSANRLLPSHLTTSLDFSAGLVEPGRLPLSQSDRLAIGFTGGTVPLEPFNVAVENFSPIRIREEAVHESGPHSPVSCVTSVDPLESHAEIDMVPEAMDDDLAPQSTSHEPVSLPHSKSRAQRKRSRLQSSKVDQNYSLSSAEAKAAAEEEAEDESAMGNPPRRRSAPRRKDTKALTAAPLESSTQQRKSSTCGHTDSGQAPVELYLPRRTSKRKGPPDLEPIHSWVSSYARTNDVNQSDMDLKADETAPKTSMTLRRRTTSSRSAAPEVETRSISDIVKRRQSSEPELDVCFEPASDVTEVRDTEPFLWVKRRRFAKVPSGPSASPGPPTSDHGSSLRSLPVSHCGSKVTSAAEKVPLPYSHPPIRVIVPYQAASGAKPQEPGTSAQSGKELLKAPCFGQPGGEQPTPRKRLHQHNPKGAVMPSAPSTGAPPSTMTDASVTESLERSSNCRSSKRKQSDTEGRQLPASVPPVTRSHCHFVRLTFIEGPDKFWGALNTFLVPQCATGDTEFRDRMSEVGVQLSDDVNVEDESRSVKIGQDGKRHGDEKSQVDTSEVEVNEDTMSALIQLIGLSLIQEGHVEVFLPPSSPAGMASAAQEANHSDAGKAHDPPTGGESGKTFPPSSRNSKRKREVTCSTEEIVR